MKYRNGEPTEITWDNEEIHMTDSSRPGWGYAFSPSEFAHEYDGMTVEQFNKDREAKGSTFRVKVHTWKTTVERY